MFFKKCKLIFYMQTCRIIKFIYLVFWSKKKVYILSIWFRRCCNTYVFVFSFLVNAANGVTSKETSDSTEKTKHGVMAILGWGILLPLGAILARYLRHRDPLWYYLHIGIQFTGFIFGLATVILGIRLYNRIQPNIPAHRGIGIFLLTLSILQVWESTIGYITCSWTCMLMICFAGFGFLCAATQGDKDEAILELVSSLDWENLFVLWSSEHCSWDSNG